MKRLLLKNMRILNPGGEIHFIDNGFILISGESIEAVGSGNGSDLKPDEVIDMNGRTVLPGMINTHTHLYSSLALGMPPPAKATGNFVEILKQVWWKLDRALDEESLRASFESGLLACLRAGVTTVFDHHSSPSWTTGSLDMLARIADDFGMNISPCFEITDRNGPENFKTGLDENLSAIQEYAGNSPYVHPLIGLHASFTLSDQSLGLISEALKELPSAGVHIHVSEDNADEEDARRRGYPSVIQRLNEFGLLNKHSIVVHGLYMLDRDRAILRERGAALIHNPTSNANNRVGMLASETILQLQCGLGTDGMQANMLAEAKEGTLIRSAQSTNSEAMVDYTALLFENNPAVASRHFGRKIGLIESGCQADLAFYDYHPRTEISESNIASHLLFGLERPTDVMTRGTFRIREHGFIDIPEQQMLNHARRQSARLWKRMKAIT